MPKPNESKAGKKEKDSKKPKTAKAKSPFTTVNLLGCIKSYEVKPGDNPDRQRLKVVCEFDLTAFGITLLPDLARLTKGRAVKCTIVDIAPGLPFKEDETKKDDEQGKLDLKAKDKKDKKSAAA